MRLLATRKAHQNTALLDPWSVVHFASGLAAGLAGLDRRWTLSAAVAWELFEQAFERHRVGQELLESHGPESLGNALVDIAVFAVGQELGEAWNATARDPDAGRG